ncbi:MAG TPA: histidine kinase dimerization/phospho-acceptor domain-containing protein, partial [Flavisolibacter sp.]
MQKARNIKILPVLMALTIVAIAAFQVYWLKKAYDREGRTLDMRTNYLFRETVFSLQSSKLKIDSLVLGDTARRVIVRQGAGPQKRFATERKVSNMVDIILKRARDSGTIVMRPGNHDDSIQMFSRIVGGRKNKLMQFLFEIDSLQDSVTVRELETAYAKRLAEQNINIPFRILRSEAAERDEPAFHQVTLGFTRPVTYHLDLDRKTPYLLRRIMVPILFSIFLVGFTTLSFSVLYRNLLRQRRLADIKNEFISNITHELKTPIATVSVAIEALRNFNASLDPQRTKEYLDISANELQRLSLLVDKVLKLSMFEKKEVELKYEPLDMKDLVEEVTSSMRLQFEKKQAAVHVTSEGDTT